MERGHLYCKSCTGWGVHELFSYLRIIMSGLKTAEWRRLEGTLVGGAGRRVR